MADSDIAKGSNNTNPQSDGTNEEPAIEVHSANAWEKADLGDAERKNKFLRLMGAGKKEHHGRFVIGDHTPDHARSTGESDDMQHKLEDQYEQSMQHRLAGGRRGHIGLGYHDTDKDADSKTEDSDVKDKDSEQAGKDTAVERKDNEDDEKVDKVAEEVAEKPNRKRESSDGHAEEDAPEEKKIKFVKSSS